MEVTERRTAVDFAAQMRWLVYEAYPDVKVVRVVLDNLNTHKLGSLYEAYEPVEARRIARRLEFHHTPKHGSWLNMAEIELSVFSKQYPCQMSSRIGLIRWAVAPIPFHPGDASTRYGVDLHQKLPRHRYHSHLAGFAALPKTPIEVAQVAV